MAQLVMSLFAEFAMRSVMRAHEDNYLFDNDKL